MNSTENESKSDNTTETKTTEVKTIESNEKKMVVPLIDRTVKNNRNMPTILFIVKYIY
jgi:hypothetical protein